MNVVLEEFNGRCKGLTHGDNLKCAIGLCVIAFPFNGRNKLAPTIFESILQVIHFRNHTGCYGLGEAHNVRLGVDKGRASGMTVGYHQVPQGLPVKPNAVPARQLDVVHVGVTAGHEVRHRDDPKDSIADSGTIELTIIFSVGTTVRHVIIASKTDSGGRRNGIDGIGDVRHGIAPFWLKVIAVEVSPTRLPETCQQLFQTFFQNFSLYSVKGLMPGLLKPVLDVFRKPVNNFFTFSIFSSSLFIHLLPCPSISSISVRFKALFLSNIGHRSSFV